MVLLNILMLMYVPTYGLQKESCNLRIGTLGRYILVTEQGSINTMAPLLQQQLQDYFKSLKMLDINYQK